LGKVIEFGFWWEAVEGGIVRRRKRGFDRILLVVMNRLVVFLLLLSRGDRERSRERSRYMTREMLQV